MTLQRFLISSTTPYSRKFYFAADESQGTCSSAGAGDQVPARVNKTSIVGS